MLDRHALKALIDAIARGDGIAFRNLYNDRADAVFGFALRLVGNQSRATEVLQHTFVEAWRGLNVAGTVWDAPDIELLRICRNHASSVMRRHGQSDRVETAMADPVNTGIASFELMQLLQTLGRLSADSRDALMAIYFDCLSADALATRLQQPTDQTTQILRKCYAELRAAEPPATPVLDRDADLLAMRQALGLAERGAAADVAAIEGWERMFAPLGELIEPVMPPDDAFAVITDRVNATANLAHAETTGRKTEIWRAMLYVLVAAVAAALIYFALIAIGDDATAQSLIL